MTDGDRAAILHSLAGAVARQQGDPVLGGFEAVRLLLAYGVSWIDLLPGPAFDGADSQLERIPLGYRLPMTPVNYGRAIRTLIAWASPFELAVWVVAINKADPDSDDFELLRVGVERLLARRAELIKAGA